MKFDLPTDIPAPGRHPITHEDFVEAEVEEVRDADRRHSFPPAYPERRIATAWEAGYDGDDEVQIPTAWRELTDEEWELALDAYRKANDEYARTGGVIVRAGPTTVTGTFTTATGATATGVLGNDGGWRWTEVSADPVAAAARSR